MSIVSGSTTLCLSRGDAAGNMGYSISFDYNYQTDDPANTIEYTNIKFSGPGSWSDYSEGDDYPYKDMLLVVLSDNSSDRR